MEYYNNDRPHLGIKGVTSVTRLAAVSTTLSETTPSPLPHRFVTHFS